MVKSLPTMQEIRFQSLGWEDPLENRMAAHSSILAWRIPWTEEPAGLKSMRLQRVRHGWAIHTFTFFITDPGSGYSMCSLSSLTHRRTDYLRRVPLEGHFPGMAWKWHPLCPKLSTMGGHSLVWRWLAPATVQLRMSGQSLSPALCNPRDCIAHQAPLSMGFPSQEYSVAISSSRGSFQSRDRTQVSCVSCIGRRIFFFFFFFFTTGTTREVWSSCEYVPNSRALQSVMMLLQQWVDKKAG